ncbi:MAG: hypothetical protein M3O61_13160 [Gemmatimonadota bacterium]|nr:hypothetical protein [Gemmatimonadota bacterium]
MMASTLFGASLLLVAGCSLDVAMNNTGRVQIQVADTSGNPVPNINADLLLDDRTTVWTSTTTGADGKAEFGAAGGGVTVRGYYVRLLLTPEWEMATDDSNDKAVIAYGGTVSVVSFKIARVAAPVT